MQQVAPFGVDGVELSADDVERGGAVGAGVQNPNPHPLPDPRRQGAVIVLVDVAVEDHRVGAVRVDLVHVDDAALGAEVEL